MKKRFFAIIFCLIIALVCFASCDLVPGTENGITLRPGFGNIGNNTGSENIGGGSSENDGNSDEHKHSFGEWTTVTAATCTTDGLREHSCNCGKKEREIIPAGHSFGEWITITEATCTTDGQKERSCDCGEKESKIIPAGHSFGEWTTVTAATCNTDGQKERSCKCGETETEDVPRLSTVGHTVKDDKCSVCGKNASEGLEFDLIDNQCYYVKGIGECEDKDIIIPSQYENLPVIKINDSAFENCSDIISIFIPDSVTEVGYRAFDKCLSLLNISVDEENTEYKSINGDLYKINADGTLFSLVKYAVAKADTTYTVPDSVTIIGNGAFYGCESLTNVIITGNSQLMWISKEAFSDCENLIKVDLNNCRSLTGIGEKAFSNCSSLSDLKIPTSITNIGYGAFDGSKIIEVENEVLYVDNWVVSLDVYSYVTSITLRDGTVGIANGYRYGYDSQDNLESIYFPSSLKYVGCGAFKAFDNLTSVYIKDIAAWCKISFWEEVVTDFSVHDGSKFSMMVMPHTNPLDRKECKLYFENGESHDQITSLVIPEDVTYIGDFAFACWRSLTSVTVPNSVTTIGLGAFRGCSSIQSMTLPFVGATLGGTTDTHSKYTDTYFGYIFESPSSVYDKNNVPSSLNTVIITGGTSIGDRAFDSCVSLTSVTISNGVTSIGSYAFMDCSSLTSIVIPEGVTSIGNSAFYGCTSLTDVYYTGTEEERAEIAISSSSNDCLINATIHYNYNPEE